MPIEIDPTTGAPIISSGPTTDFTAPTDDSLHSSVDTPTEGTSSDEGTDGTDSTTTDEPEVVMPPDEIKPKVSAEQSALIEEVCRYNCSDSQAAKKAHEAILRIMEGKQPKADE